MLGIVSLLPLLDTHRPVDEDDYSTSTRSDLNFLHIISQKIDTPEKLNCTFFFTKIISTVIFIDEG